mmetsp:Transcript_22051/g.69693  ORF Transcript_22051/g.69693 Transcript_22051/m.69693 type:complete len:309 (-) Transcript_22051:595-1521(-)
MAVIPPQVAPGVPAQHRVLDVGAGADSPASPRRPASKEPTAACNYDASQLEPSSAHSVCLRQRASCTLQGQSSITIRDGGGALHCRLPLHNRLRPGRPPQKSGRGSFAGSLAAPPSAADVRVPRASHAATGTLPRLRSHRRRPRGRQRPKPRGRRRPRALPPATLQPWPPPLSRVLYSHWPRTPGAGCLRRHCRRLRRRPRPCPSRWARSVPRPPRAGAPGAPRAGLQFQAAKTHAWTGGTARGAQTLRGPAAPPSPGLRPAAHVRGSPAATPCLSAPAAGRHQHAAAAAAAADGVRRCRQNQGSLDF